MENNMCLADLNPVTLLGKMQEEQRRKEEERVARYTPRREAKAEYRRRVEGAAMKICDLIDAAAGQEPNGLKPEQITALAAALGHAANAVQAIESYAEQQPPGGGWLL